MVVKGLSGDARPTLHCSDPGGRDCNQVEDTSDQFLKTTLVSKTFPVTGLVSCSDSQRSIASLADTMRSAKERRRPKGETEGVMTLLEVQTRGRAVDNHDVVS